jgi:hypothetical protein
VHHFNFKSWPNFAVAKEVIFNKDLSQYHKKYLATSSETKTQLSILREMEKNVPSSRVVVLLNCVSLTTIRRK